MSAGAHGVLLVDKPQGKTSHDVVAMARRALDTRKVGHAGTLDPMATGLLVLGVGEGLKVLRYLGDGDKHYLAELTLGSETDTLDAEGVLVERAVVPEGLDRARVLEVASGFLGTQRQQVPRVSAVRRGGQRLHALARRGESFEAPEREVTLHQIEVTRVADGHIEVEVWCGKGFYVRSLARDLGRALGTRAHLSALRRLGSGAHRVQDAVPASELVAAYQDEPGAREALAHAVVALPEALPVTQLVLDDEGGADALHGRPIAPGRVVSGRLPEVPTEPLWLLGRAGVLALARYDGALLHVVRGVRL